MKFYVNSHNKNSVTNGWTDKYSGYYSILICDLVIVIWKKAEEGVGGEKVDRSGMRRRM